MGKLWDLLLGTTSTDREDVAASATPPRLFPIPTHAEWASWIASAAMSPSAAMQIPGVMRCNVLIQDLTAQIELTEQVRVLTDTGQVRWERVDTPAPIVRRPDLYTPTDEWVSDFAGHLAADGEVFLRLSAHDPSTGRPTVAQVTEKGDWRVEWSDDRLYARYFWRNQPMRLWRDAAHTRYLKIPGQLHGLGPIQAYAQTLEASGKLETWAGSLFEEGGLASMYLHADYDISSDEASEIKEQWLEAHADRLTPAVLGNIKAEHAGLDPDKVQALESRMWAVQTAASIYGFNPYLLAVAMSGANITYQTLPDLFSEAIRLVIYPDYLRKIESALTELLPRGRRARFDLSEFLRADEKTRVDSGVAAVTAGLYTVDEWRGREGLPPITKENADEPAATTQP